MKILITGGSGYIGSEVVSKLKSKYEVTILSRNPKQVEGVKILKGSLIDQEFLLNNIKNYDLVINIAAIVRSSKKSEYKENISGTKNLLETLKTNKIRKLIHFSTHNVYNKKTGYYGTSKKLSEDLVKNSDLDYIILRPNYVYGIDKENYLSKLINISKRTRIALIIGDGNTKIQPINKEDLANIALYLVENFKPRTIYDASRSKAISFNEIINFTEKQLNKKIIKLHVPFFVLKLFKFVIPFDVDGFLEDRVSNKKSFSLKHDIYDINIHVWIQLLSGVHPAVKTLLKHVRQVFLVSVN